MVSSISNGNQNKKLIIHLGFPKTASSTLQYGLFKVLEDKGLVDLKMWRKLDASEHLDNRPSSRLFNRQDFLADYYNLDFNRTCILSDESFTAPLRLRQNNYGKNIEDPINFPSQIKKFYLNIFGEDLEFKILIVIRNQADLIYSQFVEEYKLVLEKGINILFGSEGETDLSGYDVYDYYKYITELYKVFGKNKVKILFFNDLKNNPEYFYKEIADILELDVAIIDKNLSKSHINKKKKSSAGYYTVGSDILIPALTNEQRNNILMHFEQGNLLLETLGLNPTLLREYGFFRNA